MGCPMHLALASFNPELIKGDIPQYCQGLTASTENNWAWYSNIFTVCSKEMKTPNTTLYNMEPLFSGKATSKKIPSTLTRKAPIRVLLTNSCAGKLQGVDSRIHVLHLKKAPNPDWEWHTICWPEIKDVKKLNQTASEGDSFPETMGPDLHNISYSCFLH